MLQKIKDMLKEFAAICEKIDKLVARAAGGRTQQSHYKRMDRLQGKVQTILSNLLEIGNDPDASDDAIDTALDAYDDITEKLESKRSALQQARSTHLKNLFPKASRW